MKTMKQLAEDMARLGIHSIQLPDIDFEHENDGTIIGRVIRPADGAVLDEVPFRTLAGAQQWAQLTGERVRRELVKLLSETSVHLPARTSSAP